jgi:hypothetical protein
MDPEIGGYNESPDWPKMGRQGIEIGGRTRTTRL